jgi:very-short-patch-repair endonuclease
VQVVRARRLRQKVPSTERYLWRFLRDRRLNGLKFRRQFALGPYVVDFICLRHRLIVELDGPFHDAARDAARDRWLESQGFRVLRFSNEMLSREPQKVRDVILEATAPRNGRG